MTLDCEGTYLQWRMTCLCSNGHTTDGGEMTVNIKSEVWFLLWISLYAGEDLPSAPVCWVEETNHNAEDSGAALMSHEGVP